MNITLVCGSLLPALRYGGTERVVWALGKELHRMGHRITFLAAPGSRCDFARIVPLDPAQPVERQLPADTELVHFHTHYAGPIAKPHLVTVHGNLPPAGATADCVFVSRNHAQRFGCEAYVWNGLDWEGDYAAPDLSLARRGYHFLGKAAWRVKNLRGAIRLSGRLGERLDVLGGYRLNLKMGLRLTLTPRVRFHGMVDNAAKKRLIERSKGLLFPVRWHEPFGLAVPESLWYGAPVFATPYGRCGTGRTDGRRRLFTRPLPRIRPRDLRFADHGPLLPRILRAGAARRMAQRRTAPGRRRDRDAALEGLIPDRRPTPDRAAGRSGGGRRSRGPCGHAAKDRGTPQAGPAPPVRA